MTEMGRLYGALSARRQARCIGFRESMLVALALYGLARADEAPAAEQAPRSDAARTPLAAPWFAPPSFSAVPLIAPPSFSVAPLIAPREFSASEFRPRIRGFAEADTVKSLGFAMDTPLQDTSVARQLAEFKSQDRVRLLTLWQNRASSLSLQAGKRGAPSLQWSTPFMHRNVAARGVFDRLLPALPHGSLAASRNNPARPSGSLALPKSLDLSSTGNTR
jgi:hypothetical protein